MESKRAIRDTMNALRRKHVDGESSQMKGISTLTRGEHKYNSFTPSRSQRYSLCTILLIATPILVVVLLTFVNAIYTIHYIWQLRPRSAHVKGPICNRILQRRKTSVSEISRDDLRQMSSRQFYDRYVQTRQGVVIRGAYDNHTLSINREIFSDQSMRKQFEDLPDYTIKVEREKVEDRETKSLSLSIMEFLDTYQKESLYLATDIKSFIQREGDGSIPELNRGLRFEDILLPALFEDFLLGDPAESSGRLLWWSSGGTKSVIHVDDTNNFESIFYGPKVCVFNCACSICACGFCHSLQEFLMYSFSNVFMVTCKFYISWHQDILYC